MGERAERDERDDAGERFGPLAAAVQAHHPSSAVLYEARALDRELERTRPAWSALLHGIESFIGHYASVLLHEPAALGALGAGCLSAVQRAPVVVLRIRAASALIGLLNAVATEVEREGIDRADAAVPDRMRSLLAALAAERPLPFDRGLLVAPMLELGQQLVMMADEGRPPTLWFALVDELNKLLLAITRQRIQGEPRYDGRWDGDETERALAVERLGPVRAERIEQDLRWLDGLATSAAAGERSSSEVFLDLSAYDARDERQRCWQRWLEAVAAQAAAGAIAPAALRALCAGMADWIRTVSDRAFLASLAGSLVERLPAVLDHVGAEGLEAACAMLGPALVGRLEQETGTGRIDRALEMLRRLGALLIERTVTPQRPLPAETLELALRLRSGPVVGQPLATADVVWRLGLLARLAEGDARRLLLGLVAGFGLEQIRLDAEPGIESGAGTPVEQSRRLVDAVAGLLGRAWPAPLIMPLRAVLRLAPVSPVELGGASCRATLVGLAPGEQRAGFLYDLKERILDRPGPGNLQDVERVLGFWLDGRVERLDGLAGPDSLAALAHTERRDAQIGRLLANLAAHAPVDDKRGVRWLARLPEPYYEAGNLAKVAGFDGLDSDALAVLTHVLCLYRILDGKLRRGAGPRLNDRSRGALLERADALLEQRRRETAMLFEPGGLDGLSKFERLERFQAEGELVAELEAIFEELIGRQQARAEAGERPDPAPLIGRLLAHAELSGLLSDGAVELAGSLLASDERIPALRRLAATWRQWRSGLEAELAPAVLDSLQRLRHNPLAEPHPTFARWLATRGDAPAQRAAAELTGMLVDELLAGDGGGLMLQGLLESWA
jgi:hypothetical protein